MKTIRKSTVKSMTMSACTVEFLLEFAIKTEMKNELGSQSRSLDISICFGGNKTLLLVYFSIDLNVISRQWHYLNVLYV